jgi:hypothetical protein
VRETATLVVGYVGCVLTVALANPKLFMFVFVSFRVNKKYISVLLHNHGGRMSKLKLHFISGEHNSTAG